MDDAAVDNRSLRLVYVCAYIHAPGRAARRADLPSVVAIAAVLQRLRERPEREKQQGHYGRDRDSQLSLTTDRRSSSSSAVGNARNDSARRFTVRLSCLARAAFLDRQACSYFALHTPLNLTEAGADAACYDA